MKRDRRAMISNETKASDTGVKNEVKIDVELFLKAIVFVENK